MDLQLGGPLKNIKNQLNASLFPLKVKIQKQILYFEVFFNNKCYNDLLTKRFLLDFANSITDFLKTEFYNFPSFFRF